MLKKFLIIAGLIATSNAFAQADKFSGFSVGLNTGFNSNTALFDTNTSTSDTTVEVGRQNTPFNTNISYVFPISQSATFGIGITYDLTNTKFTDKSVSDGLSLTSSLKNHYSVNFEPGYAFNENTLGYFKLSYASATLAGSGTSTSLSKSTTGYGYGFGTRYLIDNNLFLNMEIYQEKLSKITATISNTVSFTPTILSATVGIGYKF
jgi:opacity protein-like surface antigen